MKDRMSITTRLRHGRLVVAPEFERALYNAYGDKRVWVHVEPADRRSLAQNSFWHVAVVPHFRRCMKERGEALSHDLAHELLKSRFVALVKPPRVRNMPDGSAVAERPSTTKLSKAQFAELLEIIQAKFAEWFDGDTFAFPEEMAESKEIDLDNR